MKSLAFFWELYLRGWATPGASEDVFVKGEKTGRTASSELSGSKALSGSGLAYKISGLCFPRLVGKAVQKL